MLGRAVNLYFITKYKNISTRKPKYRRAVMRIKEFILYGLTEIGLAQGNFHFHTGYHSTEAVCKRILARTFSIDCTTLARWQTNEITQHF
jgi:hypothetical protein